MEVSGGGLGWVGWWCVCGVEGGGRQWVVSFHDVSSTSTALRPTKDLTVANEFACTSAFPQVD